MELHYNITKEDYVAFNLNYYRGNAVAQRSLKMTQALCSVIIIVGGSALMYWLKTLNVISILVYAVLAGAVYFVLPKYEERRVVKNVERILRNANNKQLCGAKTLILRETEFELSGENEDTVYQYAAVQRTASDDKHYFIFVDEFSAVIVPFSAFADEQQKQAFYRQITQNVTDEALKL